MKTLTKIMALGVLGLGSCGDNPQCNKEFSTVKNVLKAGSYETGVEITQELDQKINERIKGFGKVESLLKLVGGHWGNSRTIYRTNRGHYFVDCGEGTSLVDGKTGQILTEPTDFKIINNGSSILSEAEDGFIDILRAPKDKKNLENSNGSSSEGPFRIEELDGKYFIKNWKNEVERFNRYQ